MAVSKLTNSQEKRLRAVEATERAIVTLWLVRNDYDNAAGLYYTLGYGVGDAFVDSAEELLTINSRGQARTLTDFTRGDQINPAEVQGTLIGEFLAASAGKQGSALSARDVIESHRWALLARQAADSGELVRRG